MVRKKEGGKPGYIARIHESGLKEPLQKTSISEWLFGTKLENIIQVAKKLEKLGEQLKVHLSLYIVAHLQQRCSRWVTDSRNALHHSATFEKGPRVTVHMQLLVAATVLKGDCHIRG
nr:unnamed protein product [Callosobruchus analis]